MRLTLTGTSAAVLFLSLTPAMYAAPRLSLSRTTIPAVNLTLGANGGEFVDAVNIGDGALALTATSSAPWMSATVGVKGSCAGAGGNCYRVGINLNTAALPPGIYTESITVTDPNAIDSPQEVVITINNDGVPSVMLTAYTTPLAFWTSTEPFPLFLTGTGYGISVSTTSGGKWLNVVSGQASSNIIQVSAQTGQAVGTYLGTVVISGSSVASDNKSIPVRLIITSDPVISTMANTKVSLSSYPDGPAQSAMVSFANMGTGTLNITGAAGAAAFLTATVHDSDSIRISASPAGLAAGVYKGLVTLTSNAANNEQIRIPVQLTVALAGQPLIISGGVVNAANGASGALAQGDIGVVYGNQLAPTGASATSAATPLSATLSSTQVLVNNVPAPLYYASPGQINFQVPYSLPPGQFATVQVISNGKAGNVRSFPVVASAPRLLSFVSFIEGNYGVIVNSRDGSLTLPSGTSVPKFLTHPAKPGDTITIYGTGFGQTSPAAVEGQASALATIPNVTVTFGGLFVSPQTVGTAIPLFTGLTPTAVGLYQVNVKIPDNTVLGSSIALAIRIGNEQSNIVKLAISATGN